MHLSHFVKQRVIPSYSHGDYVNVELKITPTRNSSTRVPLQLSASDSAAPLAAPGKLSRDGGFNPAGPARVLASALGAVWSLMSTLRLLEKCNAYFCHGLARPPDRIGVGTPANG